MGFVHKHNFISGLMYVVGGSNDLSEELTSVESFNPVTKEWTSLADMNVKRSYAAVAVLNDCLYAVGGWNETDGALKSVEKLSFSKVVINPLPDPLPLPETHFWSAFKMENKYHKG